MDGLAIVHNWCCMSPLNERLLSVRKRSVQLIALQIYLLRPAIFYLWRCLILIFNNFSIVNQVCIAFLGSYSQIAVFIPCLVQLGIFLDALAIILCLCQTKLNVCWITHLLHRLLRLSLMQCIWIQLEILQLSLESFGHIRRSTKMTYVWKSHLSSSLVDEHIRIVKILITKAEIILVAS